MSNFLIKMVNDNFWRLCTTFSQGWTSLNKNPSWSFLASIILPELELELLGSNICYQCWSWSFWALHFFIELEAGSYKSWILQAPDFSSGARAKSFRRKNVGAKSGAAKFLLQINLKHI